jgi:phosphate:Na+ symporter
MQAFDLRDVSRLEKVAELEDLIDDQTADLQDKHVERVKAGLCTAQIGSVYLQTVSNLERVGDHINNVAMSITQYRKIKKTVRAKI